MATRWFSDDSSNNDDEADKNDAADKTEVGDGESVEDLLGDLDELAEWLGDEQLGSELEDIQDFFQARLPKGINNMRTKLMPRCTIQYTKVGQKAKTTCHSMTGQWRKSRASKFYLIQYKKMI